MKVYISRGYPIEAVAELKKDFDVEMHDSWVALPKEELIKKTADADILITFTGVEIDDEVLDASPKLKLIISFYNMSRNPEAQRAAEERCIKVEALPPSYGWIVTGVAELTWGLIIAVGRRFVEGRKFITAGKFTHSEQANHLLLGEGLSGRRLGIIGAGRIGREVARRAAGFDMDLVYYDPAPNDEIESYGAKLVDKATLIETSDYITIHIPNTDDNRHFIGEAEFKRMKNTAIIINTARGRIIDEQAMIKALQQKQIAGAGLEVYEHEPDVPVEFWEMDNVMLSPHVGGSLRKERAEHFMRAVDICRKFKNETL